MPQFFDDRWIDLIRKMVRQFLFQEGHLRRGPDDNSYTAPEVGCWAKITDDNIPMSDNSNRFQYPWTEQRETATGWEDVPSGRSGTSTTNFALNSIEANNPSSPLPGDYMGNSVDVAGTATTLDPVRGNPVVWLRLGWDTDKNPTWRFSYENSVDCGGGG